MLGPYSREWTKYTVSKLDRHIEPRIHPRYPQPFIGDDGWRMLLRCRLWPIGLSTSPTFLRLRGSYKKLPRCQFLGTGLRLSFVHPSSSNAISNSSIILLVTPMAQASGLNPCQSHGRCAASIPSVCQSQRLPTAVCRIQSDIHVVQNLGMDGSASRLLSPYS